MFRFLHALLASLKPIVVGGFAISLFVGVAKYGPLGLHEATNVIKSHCLTQEPTNTCMR